MALSCTTTHQTTASGQTRFSPSRLLRVHRRDRTGSGRDARALRARGLADQPLRAPGIARRPSRQEPAGVPAGRPGPTLQSGDAGRRLGTLLRGSAAGVLLSLESRRARSPFLSEWTADVEECLKRCVGRNVPRGRATIPTNDVLPSADRGADSRIDSLVATERPGLIPITGFAPRTLADYQVL